MSVMSVPSRAMLPPLASSRPAIRRSRVDLPQPEGRRDYELAVADVEVVRM
ncbi:hypothetical protein P4234_16220 [Pseudomonas aeruginosa]|nr:hypothetical protein [Pseudomonas aeruginosa]